MQRLFLGFVVVLLGCLVTAANLKAEDAAGYINRGIACYEKGEYDKAIADFTEAIRLDPKYESAYLNRGIVWGVKGQNDKAIADYNEAIRLNPNLTEAHYNRGKVWYEKGAYDKAITDFTEVIRLNPKNVDAYNNRGIVRNEKGEFAKAIADYNKALAVTPDHIAARNSLAWLQATCPDEKYRDGKKAVENATKAYQLDGSKHWQCLGTIAAAYAESGDFEKAKEWAAKAIAMVTADKSVSDKDKSEMRSRLELYKQGKPYREELKKK